MKQIRITRSAASLFAVGCCAVLIGLALTRVVPARGDEAPPAIVKIDVFPPDANFHTRRDRQAADRGGNPCRRGHA